MEASFSRLFPLARLHSSPFEPAADQSLIALVALHSLRSSRW
jgi:hypothetical protein